MPTLLIKNADVLVTMDETRREISGGIFVRDGVIEAVGDVPETADTVVDAKGCVVTPGLVNTHHHLYQT
ncbi:MAG: 8-oxoguanine deaminase, partial [Alphaproteobacteria bacterium]